MLGSAARPIILNAALIVSLLLLNFFEISKLSYNVDVLSIMRLAARAAPSRWKMRLIKSAIVCTFDPTALTKFVKQIYRWIHVILMFSGAGATPAFDTIRPAPRRCQWKIIYRKQCGSPDRLPYPGPSFPQSSHCDTWRVRDGLPTLLLSEAVLCSVRARFIPFA
eukprot:SAG31_NODE_3329_length_4400_cov_2.494071_2_plen_165_part_00